MRGIRSARASTVTNWRSSLDAPHVALGLEAGPEAQELVEGHADDAGRGGAEREHGEDVVPARGEEPLAQEVAQRRVLHLGDDGGLAAGDLRLRVLEVAAVGGALDAERRRASRERKGLVVFTRRTAVHGALPGRPDVRRPFS